MITLRTFGTHPMLQIPTRECSLRATAVTQISPFQLHELGVQYTWAQEMVRLSLCLSFAPIDRNKEERMLKISATVAFLLLSISTVVAEPIEKWRASGLSNPESVLFDPSANILYVSNIAGNPGEKDGKGFISRLSTDGKIETLEWAKGLDAPKGLALVGNRLYVSDIDQLVAIDTATGAVAKRWPAVGAKFLNDVVADAKGRVFVSDMVTNQIWQLDGDQFAVWLEDACGVTKHSNRGSSSAGPAIMRVTDLLPG